jgi:hypothetical protein
MRELKGQVIGNWKKINRKYRDPLHGGNTILHFVCQEGYITMLNFLLEDANHPDFDSDVVLDVNPKNNKNRFVLDIFLCYL